MIKAEASWDHQAASTKASPLIINNTLWLTEYKLSNSKQLKLFHTPVTKYNCLPLALTPLITYLTASLLDDLIISLAVGTPTRLNVMP